MKVHPVAYLSSLMGTTMTGSPSDSFVEHLLIDSRKLVFPQTTLFFAIKTEQGDGHQYIDELYREGVRSFVVSTVPDLASFPDACFLSTDNVVSSLQKLAIAHRKQFEFPVIGITGSNGKTIVKEWLNHLLQQEKTLSGLRAVLILSWVFHSASGRCRRRMNWVFLKRAFPGPEKWTSFKR